MNTQPDRNAKSKTIRLPDKVAKGYDAADLADPWSRYVTVKGTLARDTERAES